MQKFKLLFLFGLLWSLASCGKSEDSTSFQCKIDGTNYSVDGLFAYGVKDDDNLIFYGVDGSGSTQRSILIWVPASAKAGDVFTDKNVFRVDYTDSSQQSFSTHLSDKATGKITISNVSETQASGTFEAIIYDLDKHTTSKKLTEGKFNVTFR